MELIIEPVTDHSGQAKGSTVKAKTYNSRDSLMVTHLTTNPPVSCLNIAEQTGCVVLKILWSYVAVNLAAVVYVGRI
jgi:hypothetical protein